MQPILKNIQQHYNMLCKEIGTRHLGSKGEKQAADYILQQFESYGLEMAFEYYVSYCLLEGKIDELYKHLYKLNSFDYEKIPRHIEEAILITRQLSRRAIAIPGREISQETIAKFSDFSQIIKKYNNDKNYAYNELLTKYKDTYWFYALYLYKPKGN